MRKEMKKTAAAALAFIMGLGLIGCVPAASSSDKAGADTGAAAAEDPGALTRVRVGTDTMQLAYAQVIAKEKGFYEENGLDVEITTYAAGIETINAIVTGAADIGGAYDFALCTRLIPGSIVRVVSGFITNKDGAYCF